MYEDADELELNIGFINIRIKGRSAVRSMRWPLAMVVMLMLILLIGRLEGLN